MSLQQLTSYVWIFLRSIILYIATYSKPLCIYKAVELGNNFKLLNDVQLNNADNNMEQQHCGNIDR